MGRESTLIRIPEQYKVNEQKGLCRVCGGAIVKPYRKYCGDDCWAKYQQCFLTWGMHKKNIIKERGHRCEKCGVEGKPIELDHITAIINGGDMWNKENLQLLCHQCHNKKTGADMRRRNAGGAEQTLLATKLTERLFTMKRKKGLGVLFGPDKDGKGRLHIELSPEAAQELEDIEKKLKVARIPDSITSK